MMNTETTAGTGKEPARKPEGDAAFNRAIEAAKEVIAELTASGADLKYEEAARELSDRIDDDPAMILAVIGADAWSAACLTVIRKAYASAHAKRLSGAAKMRQAGDVARSKEKSAVDAYVRGMLGTLRCGAQPIGLCTRPELLAQAVVSERHARVYRAVAVLLPDDVMPVGGAVTAAKLKEIWDSNSSS